jgi:hypothetical protein
VSGGRRGERAGSASVAGARAGTSWKLESVRWYAVSRGYAPTVVLPLLSDLAQLGDAVELGVKIQYILAVEALAGLDEVQVVLLELPQLHDMVLGALELWGQHDPLRMASSYARSCVPGGRRC